MRSIFDNDIPNEDILLFLKIRKAMTKLSGIDFGEVLSCHMIARAIAQTCPGMTVLDGLFYPNFIHSWCVTENLNIIDVYPVGIISGPILMTGSIKGPAHLLYKVKNIQKDYSLSFSDKKFIESVEKVKTFLKK